MPFERNALGRAFGYVPAALRFCTHPMLRYEGLEHLAQAAGRNVTIVSSHASSQDVIIIDKACRNMFGRDGYPIFIKRKDIQFKLGIKFSKGFSKWLYDQCDGGGITIDQSDIHALSNARPAVEAAFAQGKIIALFPGATRYHGYVNGMFPKALQAYALLIKRSRLEHYFLPCGITYGLGRSCCRFGELYSGDPKAVANDLTRIVCDLCGMDPKSIVDEDTVRQYIKNRE